MLDGNEPFSMFELMSIAWAALRLPIVSGTDPDSWLPDALRNVTAVSPPRLDGNVPVRILAKRSLQGFRG